MIEKLEFQLIKPEGPLNDFVHCFCALKNFSAMKNAVVFPNGKIDLVFALNESQQFTIALLGLETKPKYTNQEVSRFFSVSFHPLAIEYLFKEPVADILNSGKILPENFWNISRDVLNNFDSFFEKIMQKIVELLPKHIDERKRQLFKLILDSNGEIPVKELSEKIFWSQRRFSFYMFNR